MSEEFPDLPARSERRQHLEQVKTGLGTLLGEIGGEAFSTGATVVDGGIRLRITENTIDREARKKFQNALEFLGGEPVGRAVPLTQADRETPQSLTIQFPDSPDLASRMSLLAAFEHGRAYVHLMEMKPGNFRLGTLVERVLNPILGLMAGNPDAHYNDLDLLAQGQNNRNIFSAPERGATAVPGRALKAHAPVPGFEGCEFGLMFDGADKQNVRNLFFSDVDVCSRCLQTDKGIDPLLVLHNAKSTSPEIITMQTGWLPGQPTPRLPVTGSAEQDAKVEQALDHYWEWEEKWRKKDPDHIRPEMDPEIDFNAKIGGLRAILVDNPSGMPEYLAFEMHPESLLRSLFIREYIGSKYPAFIKERYPESGALPVVLYSPNGKSVGFTEVDYSPERLHKALEAVTEKSHRPGQEKLQDELRQYRWAIDLHEQREAARTPDLPSH